MLSLMYHKNMQAFAESFENQEFTHICENEMRTAFKTVSLEG